MIKKDKWYSVKEIQEEKLLKMFLSRYSILKWIRAGRLKAVIVGSNFGRRYKIKGSWLIEFIAEWESRKF